nr:hypothetical protein [Tanacetum cinerariifolium]
FFSPLASVASLVLVEEALAPVELSGSPSSTTVDQDAPLPSTSQTTRQSQPQTIPLCVEEESHNLKVAHMSNDPYFGILIPETKSEESSSSDVIPTTVHSDALISKHLSQWTKDHPLQNIIGDPSRPVSTRLQPHAQALFRYYDAFLTSVEPKTYKDILTQSCWIEAMQKELNEFEHLKVWELVHRLDKMKAPRAWYDLLSSFLLSQGFSKDTVDLTLFITRKFKDILLMSMTGKVSFFLRLQISQSPRGIFLNQSNYALEPLKKYEMKSCDLVDTPMVEKSKLDKDTQGKAVDPTHYHGMVGTLMYLISSKPDMDSAIALIAFEDADHAGCQDTRRRHLKVCNCWETDLLAVLWMRLQLTDYGLGFNKIPMYCDNKSVIALCCNNVQHSRSEHIDIRYHFIKEQVENEVVELYFFRMEYQLSDIFTKALCRERIKFLIDHLGMRSFTPKTLKELADKDEENMNPIATQKAVLDNALVHPEKRLTIERCNARIAFSKPQREETYQVILEALKLSPCYPLFVITTEVLEIYMHEFQTTIKKIKNSDAYNFKLEKKFRVDTEVFREIL